jgi:hypothetical protein
VSIERTICGCFYSDEHLDRCICPEFGVFVGSTDKLEQTKKAERERKDAHKAELKAHKEKKAQVGYHPPILQTLNELQTPQQFCEGSVACYWGIRGFLATDAFLRL